MAQWLRVCLPVQGTRVRALVWEDPTCRGATKPVSHNYWACASGACAPQRERPRQWEARAPRWRAAPTRRNWRKPSHRNEDPTQPKIKKKKKILFIPPRLGRQPCWGFCHTQNSQFLHMPILVQTIITLNLYHLVVIIGSSVLLTFFIYSKSHSGCLLMFRSQSKSIVY